MVRVLGLGAPAVAARRQPLLEQDRDDDDDSLGDRLRRAETTGLGGAGAMVFLVGVAHPVGGNRGDSGCPVDGTGEQVLASRCTR